MTIMDRHHQHNRYDAQNNRLAFLSRRGGLVAVLLILGVWAFYFHVTVTMSDSFETIQEKALLHKDESFSSARQGRMEITKWTDHADNITRLGSLLECEVNPYLPALDPGPTEIMKRMSDWLASKSENGGFGPAVRRAITDKNQLSQHTHERFFPFDDSMVNCTTSCIGGPCSSDESKIVCGLSYLQQHVEPPCIVYSIGGHNWWAFEKDVLKRTPCQVHTFDCTGNPKRFHPPPNGRLFFHHVCLGDKHEPKPTKCHGYDKCGETWTLPEMMERLGHTRIDLFKMDIEGFEWPLFESWLGDTDTSTPKSFLPMQMMVEIHYETQFTELRLDPNIRDFKNVMDIIDLQARLLQAGYALVKRDDNPDCPHCTELTLLRVAC